MRFRAWVDRHLINHHHPPRNQAIATFVLELVISLAVGYLVIDRIPAIHTLGRSALEAFQVFDPEEPAKHVVLVNIDQEAFNEDFGGHSPLAAAKLHELLAIVADGSPLLIAVDIDTSHVDFVDLAKKLGPHGEIGDTPIVWARGGECEGRDCEQQRFVLGGVLADEHGPEEASRFGAAVFKREDDGMVREFTRCVDAYIKGDLHQYPTFHWAIVKSITGDEQRNGGDASKLTVLPPYNPCATHSDEDVDLVIPRVRYQFAELSAKELLEQGGNGDGSGPGKQDENMLSNRIVLVGGTYDQRDRHLTSFGEVDGYHLLARAIEAERRGDLAKKESEGLRLLTDISLGALIAGIHYIFVHAFAGIVTALTMTLLPVILSYVLFVSGDYWLDSLPFLFSFWVMTAYFAGPVAWVAQQIFPDTPKPTVESESVLVVEERVTTDGGGTRFVSLRSFRHWRSRVLGRKP